MAAGSRRNWAALPVVFLLMNSRDFTNCETQHVSGAKNKNVTFSISRAISFQDILWKQQKNKVIEWNVKFTKDPKKYKDSTDLNTTSGDLTIYNLKPSDQDEYEFKSPSIKDSIKFSLKVVEYTCCETQLEVGIMDKSVTFIIASTTALKNIVWKKGKDIVIEWKESHQQTHSDFKDRVSLNTTTGDLTISKLTLTDEDKYEFESPESKNMTKFSLKVVEYICCETQLVVGIMNENVTFSVLNSIPFKHIVWKKGMAKFIEWDKSHPPSPSRNNVELNTTTGDLTLYDLKSSDEDEYVFESPSIQDKITFSLQVIESLPPITINCTETNDSYVLHCNLQESYQSHKDLIKYFWSCPSEQCGRKTPSIHFEKDDDLSQEVSCSVMNPVSTQTTSMTLQNCIEAHRRHRYLIVVAVFLPVILAVVAMVFMRCCRNSTQTT